MMPSTSQPGHRSHVLEMLWKRHVDERKQQGGFFSAAGSHSCAEQRISASSKSPVLQPCWRGILISYCQFYTIWTTRPYLQILEAQELESGVRDEFLPVIKMVRLGSCAVWGRKDMKAWVQKGSLSSGESIIQSTPWVYSLQALVHIQVKISQEGKILSKSVWTRR